LGDMNFVQLERADVVRIVAQIEQDERISAWTKRDYKSILKMLLHWMGKDGDWIKSKIPKRDIQPEDMLDQADVNAMIDAAKSLRDKAFIATLFEGGFRVGELAGARIKDVVIDSQGTILMVRGKTGLRRVRLVTSTPFISQWINAHPGRNDRESPLWVYSDRMEPLRYPAIRKQLTEIAQKAGIKKKVNPHNFRHSRATYLASRLTEAQMEKYLGWEHGSDMPRIYVHMSGRDVDAAIMEMYGLGGSEKKIEETVKKCPFCETMNSIEAKFCYMCKRPLEITAEGVLDLEEEVKALKTNVEALEAQLAARLQKDDQMGEFLEKMRTSPQFRALVKEVVKSE